MPGLLLKRIIKCCHRNSTRVFIGIFLLFLLVKSLFYNSLIGIVSPPDYQYHEALVLAYAQSPSELLFSTVDEIGNLCSLISRVSPVTTLPNLYASLLGKVLFLLEVLKLSDSLKTLNLLQTGFGILTIVYTYKLAREVLRRKIAALFVMVILSSVQMFSYQINFLTYDNLLNLLSIVVIYHSVLFHRTLRLNHFLIALLAILVAMLTKITILPLALLVSAHFATLLAAKWRNYSTSLRRPSWGTFLTVKNSVFISLIIFFGILNLFFYGRNFVLYGTPNPPAAVVGEIEYCSEAPIMVSRASNEETRMNLLSYALQWERKMEERIFNITSHKSLYKPQRITDLYHYLLIISSICFWLYYRLKNAQINILLFYSLGYSLFLLLAVNYMSYIRLGDFNLALQGRYIFPVIGPLVILFVYSIENIRIVGGKFFNTLLLTFITIFFLVGDNYYLLNGYKSWVFSQPVLSHELGNTGPVKLGEQSVSQIIEVPKDGSYTGIALYTSTYNKKLPEGSLTFVLLDENCTEPIQLTTMKSVKDNSFAYATLELPLENNRLYCFHVRNLSSANPVTFWFSGRDLLGQTAEHKDKDLVYDLIDTTHLRFLE